ncbi:ArnT family glycosyltransferase [Conchiformibius kuhniae]|uniref:ArnT family glycosyltransferase n=2 Tax=Conchiformibius kuhniae TaxID=211502 RepID=A0A8T9MVK9_9NEIS|nr:glycosyltransferase family 39 protein [Conchiformibius kuhniae]
MAARTGHFFGYNADRRFVLPFARIMLTRLPNPAPSRPAAPVHESVWLLWLLVCAWLWPGVFGHDLWNPAEPHIFAAVQENMGQTAWLPTVRGEPYFALAPVYVWTAKMWTALLSPHWLDAYAAARLASVSFAVWGLTAAGLAASALMGAYCGRMTVLMLTASAGLLGMGHFLSGMTVVFAGAATAWWGLAVLRRNTAAAIVLLAAATVLLGQSAGWLAAGCVPLVMLLLCRSPCWRTGRLLAAALGTAVCALPCLAVQPAVLAKTDPAAFTQYWQMHLFGAFGGLTRANIGFHGGYYLQNLLWFAFPAWALALHAASRLRGRAHAGAHLCACWIAVFGVYILLHPQRFQEHLIVLLVPLAVFGSAGLDRLKRGVAAYLNWFGIAAFGAAALFLWLGFLAMNFGFPAKLAERAAYFSPDYVRQLRPEALSAALLATALWLWAVTRRHIRGRQAVCNWAAGITLVWALLMTLFLPWLDAAKSYRPLVAKIHAALPPLAAGECLHIPAEAAEAALAWAQYAPFPASPDPDCRYRLSQYRPPAPPAATGKILWQGRRPRNKTEAFVLTDTR